MFIIAGLGNPTREYEGTRHNVGFDVIDRLAARYNIDVDVKKHRALIGKGMIAGQKVILAKPQTYMNLSGESIRSILDYYKVDPETELIVIYDDISLDVGKWFTPLREAVQAFVESTQEYVTGEVKFKLYKGNIIKAGTTSPYSLYNESLASFTTGDLYDHHDADGFITLFGLPLKVRAMKMQELEKNNNK